MDLGEVASVYKDICISIATTPSSLFLSPPFNLSSSHLNLNPISPIRRHLEVGSNFQKKRIEFYQLAWFFYFKSVSPQAREEGH